MQLTTRQHQWLTSLLTEVISLEEGKTTKIQSFIKACASFLPFDFIIIDTDLNNFSENGVYGLERTGFDEYLQFDFETKKDEYAASWQDFLAMRKSKIQNRALFSEWRGIYKRLFQDIRVKDKIRRDQRFSFKIAGAIASEIRIWTCPLYFIVEQLMPTRQNI